ncbi:MAG: hypothetical protein OEX00_09835, partial [Gammaproteobacteria bacterium]|nr:hypothetical protein [Gammaproteobacteria bacterium]
MSGSDRRDIFSTHAPTPIQKLSFPLLEEKKVSLYVKRDDLIHPLVSGNKWRKLKYNVYHALEYDIGRLLTFGGAYSNHIHAFAAVCSLYSLDG